MLPYFQPFTSAASPRANDEPWPWTSKQADAEGVESSAPLPRWFRWWCAINRPRSPLSYTPGSCSSHHPNLQPLGWAHPHRRLGLPVSSTSPRAWDVKLHCAYIVSTPHRLFIISFLLLLYVSVSLGFMCNLVWFGMFCFWGSQSFTYGS